MAKRRRKQGSGAGGRRPREKPETSSYTDPEGNVLSLRDELSPGTVEKLSAREAKQGASAEDIWRRRTELLFERLAVSWEISGLEPITDQQMLLGRFRLANAAEQSWVRKTINAHLERFIPELLD